MQMSDAKIALAVSFKLLTLHYHHLSLKKLQLRATTPVGIILRLSSIHWCLTLIMMGAVQRMQTQIQMCNFFSSVTTK